MEIVKRLGEEEKHKEDFDFDFKDHYLKEDEKLRREPNKVLLTIVGITTIGILSYIGFITLQKNNIAETNSTNQTIIKKDTVNIKDVVNNAIEAQQSEISSVLIKKTAKKEVEPKVKEEIEKPILYTEVLALKIVAPIKPKEDVKKIDTKKTVIIKKEVKRPVPKKLVLKKTIPKKQRTVIIKKGDTLALLAKKFYGNSMNYPVIVRANKSIKSHKTNLKLGQKVIIPYVKNTDKRRFVIVKSGYSLAYISKKFYGNVLEVQKIVNANHKIKSKESTLRIGQKVYVPK